MDNRLLIKNGKIVCATHTVKADVLIEDGVIIHIAPVINVVGTQIIDAFGQFVTPGGVDPHVHLAVSTHIATVADNFEEGSLAALAGGTTTIIDFVTPERHEPLLDAVRKRKKEHRDYFDPGPPPRTFQDICLL